MEGSTAATGSVAEFLGLLADLSLQQRACAPLRYVGGYTAPLSALLVGPPLGKGLGPSRLILSAISIAARRSTSAGGTEFAPVPYTLPTPAVDDTPVRRGSAPIGATPLGSSVMPSAQ